MAQGAKILILDIETAPNVVYTWGLYDQQITHHQIIKTEYMLCWGAKWLGEAKVYTDAIINYPTHFKHYPQSDAKIAPTIWKLVDEADIVVTHNGLNFDLKWLNTVFLRNHLKPVSSFKSVDTLKELRANFRFISYKLDQVSKELGLGSKLAHEGFALWTKCMAGDKKAWQKMVDYNIQDVRLLEKIYLLVRPYLKTHPNLALYQEVGNGYPACPVCQNQEFDKKGFAYTQTGKYQRLVCVKCGKNVRLNHNILGKGLAKSTVLRNV